MLVLQADQCKNVVESQAGGGHMTLHPVGD